MTDADDESLVQGPGKVQRVRVTVKLPPGTDPEMLMWSLTPIPEMALGEEFGMGVLQSRAAHRAEQRLVRQLAKAFKLDTPAGREVLHDLLQEAKREGVEGYQNLREWIENNLP